MGVAGAAASVSFGACASVPSMTAPHPPLSGGAGQGDTALARFGVLTVSDRASAGTYEDLSGPAILQFFSEAVSTR